MRLRFTIRDLLWLAAVVALAIALTISQRQLARLELDAAANRPLSAEDVAEQFQKNLGAGAVPVKVEDVRYSPKDDAYRIEFSWLDPKSGQNWSTEVRLLSDGYGKYTGVIASAEFLKALGYTGQMYVTVAKPSPLKQ
jgi:hypothetical protein